MADVKDLVVRLSLENKQLLDANKKMQSQMEQTKEKVTGLKGAFSKLKLAYVAVAGIIGGVLVKGLSKLTRLASDAQETFSKFSTTFRDVSKEAEGVAKSFSKNFGLSELAAKKLLSSTGDLLIGFDFTGEAALDLSKQVNELAVDLGSFQNVSSERASEALTKALLGETESAKSLGIVIRQNTQEFRDNVAEIVKTQGVTEQQAKSIEILRQATEQSKNAIGDFARTQKSFANQSKILKARLTDLGVTLGSALLPSFTGLLGIFNRLLPNQQDLSDVTDSLVRNSTEYAKITNTLATESDKLTKAESAKLAIRRAELKLDIIKNIEDINNAYQKNIKLIPRFKNNIKAATEFLNRASIKANEYQKQLDAMGEKSELTWKERRKYNEIEFLLNKTLDNSKNASEGLADMELKLAKATSVVEDAEKDVNFALKENFLTKTDIKRLDDELIQSATDYKNKKVENDNEVVNSEVELTDAMIDEIDKRMQAEEEYQAFLATTRQQNTQKYIQSSIQAAQIISDATFAILANQRNAEIDLEGKTDEEIKEIKEQHKRFLIYQISLLSL